MPAHRILRLNAISTAACAVAMLAGRQTLHPLFGLASPALLDVLAVGFLAYAATLGVIAARPAIDRAALIACTIADAAWVGASGVVLLLFWGELAPIARFLVIAVAVVVEVFAMLQFRAAGRVARRVSAHA